jgi:flagellar hook protein FlgE
MSSLFAALGVSVSGLNAQSQAIGNISDNLANAQTTGFKTIGTSFEDLVTASSATNNSPGGVTATPSYQNDVQGNIDATTTTTNLAISGEGYFQVESAAQTSSGATDFTGTYYTRQGDFTLNKDGYMVNSSGYYLDGYAITSDGTVDTASTTPVQISSLLDNPVPTSTVDYAANLPASAATGYTSTASTVEVYDALGNTHEMSLTWSKTADNTWSVHVDVADGLGTGSDYTADIPVSFNSASNIGTIAGVSSGTGYSVDSNASDEAGASFSLTFPGSGTQTIDLNLGTLNAATGVTQYANSSSSVSVSSITQNGLGEGSYSSVSISTSGIVSINYTNGSTRSIYQIPIALFNSPDNLQRASGGVYSATLASGASNLHLAGTNGSGTISSSSLEASDVDIATEFTTMIQSQQVYSANAKVVTTVNSMLDTIIQAVQS